MRYSNPVGIIIIIYNKKYTIFRGGLTSTLATIRACCPVINISNYISNYITCLLDTLIQEELIH